MPLTESSRKRRARMSPSSWRIHRFTSNRTERPSASANSAAPMTTAANRKLRTAPGLSSPKEMLLM